MLCILLEGRSGQQAPGLPSGNVQAASGVANRTRSYQTAQSLIGRHFDSNPPIEGQLPEGMIGVASLKSLKGTYPHMPPSMGVRGVFNGAFFR
jgi:hypothetical protein